MKDDFILSAWSVLCMALAGSIIAAPAGEQLVPWQFRDPGQHIQDAHDNEATRRFKSLIFSERSVGQTEAGRLAVLLKATEKEPTEETRRAASMLWLASRVDVGGPSADVPALVDGIDWRSVQRNISNATMDRTRWLSTLFEAHRIIMVIGKQVIPGNGETWVFSKRVRTHPMLRCLGTNVLESDLVLSNSSVRLELDTRFRPRLGDEKQSQLALDVEALSGRLMMALEDITDFVLSYRDRSMQAELWSVRFQGLKVGSRDLTHHVDSVLRATPDGPALAVGGRTREHITAVDSLLIEIYSLLHSDDLAKP